MKADDFLLQMKAILADERTALRQLDVKGVTEAGIRKEALLKAVSTAPDDDKKALAAALLEVKAELRQNLVLLAHARDYIRDALALCTQSTHSVRPRLQASL